MEQRLQDVLRGEDGNYLFPFLWLHGEMDLELTEMMDAIYNSGIRAVCLESRTHPDFLGEKWWKDLDVIMSYARAHEMKVWILDDVHFPTGACANQINEGSPYGKIYLDHYTVDVVGPEAENTFFLDLRDGESLVGVVAAKRTGEHMDRLTDFQDITAFVCGKSLFWDVPDGYWNIIVIKNTPFGTGRKKYLNLIDANAVDFFLKTVYEPHFTHFKADFGSTFAGFFSDEPELGNCRGEYGHHAVIGLPTMPLPWCGELSDTLSKMWGSQTVLRIASLWNENKDVSPQARFDYMNAVTDLYERNFCGRIGTWCRDHGVSYVGHVIEDDGVHGRLGGGTGHYFKSLWGQDMAGIDVVLQQIRPGYGNMDFYYVGGKGTYDGTFFQHGLASMGTSLGRLDPKKHGRTMCEVYGAYGWTEGLKLMKWITDHMLARGVNYFVPHAFTGQKFPDEDCPPHFYAWGNTPQYPWSSYLWHYMNRMCHLFNGGKHIAHTAVLYTAELEWIGDVQPFEEIGEILDTHQIGWEVIPLNLLETGHICDGELCIGDVKVKVIIIPRCTCIPESFARWILRTTTQGFAVIFAGAYPEIMPSIEELGYRSGELKNMKGIAINLPANKLKAKLMTHCRCADHDAASLLTLVKLYTTSDICCENIQEALRVYHYQQSKADFFMLFNENAHETLKTKIYFSNMKNCICFSYDALSNQIFKCNDFDKENSTLSIELEAGESKMICWMEEEDAPDNEAVTEFQCSTKSLKLDGKWHISFRGYNETSFSNEQISELYNITGRGAMEYFSGTIQYKRTFVWKASENGNSAELMLGDVYETAEIRLNGKKQAVLIAPPYRCLIHDLLDGTNELEIIVANTLVHALRDPFSFSMPVERSGLLGPVWLRCIEIN